MIWSYITVGLILASVSLLSAFMFMSSRAHYLIKITLATVIVVASIYAWQSTTSIFGYPVTTYPRDGSTILAYRIDKPHGAIYFWIQEEIGPRAYALPHSEELAKDTQEAEKEAQKQGGRMIFHLGKKGGGDGDGNGKGGKRAGNGKNKAGAGTGIMSDNEPPPVSIDVEPSMPAKE